MLQILHDLSKLIIISIVPVGKERFDQNPAFLLRVGDHADLIPEQHGLSFFVSVTGLIFFPWIFLRPGIPGRREAHPHILDGIGEFFVRLFPCIDGFLDIAKDIGEFYGMAGAEMRDGGPFCPVIHISLSAVFGMEGGLCDGGHAEDQFIKEFCCPVGGTAFLKSQKSLCQGSVLFIEAVDDAPDQKRGQAPVHEPAAHLPDPVPGLVRICTDEHIDPGTFSFPIGLIEILRQDDPVAHRKNVVVVELFVYTADPVFIDGRQIFHTGRAGRLQEPVGERPGLFPAVGKGDRAALCDHSFEKPLCRVDQRQEGDAGCTRRFSEQGHVVRISAKAADIPADPGEGADLVEQAQVSALPVVLPALHTGKIHETKETDAVIDRDQDHISLPAHELMAVVQGVSRPAPAVGTAVDKNHDRFPGRKAVLCIRGRSFGRESFSRIRGRSPGRKAVLLIRDRPLVPGTGPDIQGQAVLPLPVQRSSFRSLFCLDAGFPEKPRFVNTIVRGSRFRSLPAAGAHRRYCIGNALVGPDTVLLGPHKSPVMALYSQSGVIGFPRQHSVHPDEFLHALPVFIDVVDCHGVFSCLPSPPAHRSSGQDLAAAIISFS